MKALARFFSRPMFVLFLLLILVGTLAAQIPPSGPFGFLLETSFTDNGSPQGGAALVGLMNFDGAGNVSGHYTLTIGSPDPHSGTTSGTLNGTYLSSPDGTGTMVITLSDGGAGAPITATLDMVIADGGKGLNLVLTNCTCGIVDTVVSGVARRTKQRFPQSVAALQGSYGGQFTFSPQPARALMVASFDGAGTVTLSGTFVDAGGTVTPLSPPWVETYTVDPDGTGTITPILAPPSPGKKYVFVITDGGSGLLWLQTFRSGDGVSAGTARLQ